MPLQKLGNDILYVSIYTLKANTESIFVSIWGHTHSHIEKKQTLSALHSVWSHHSRWCCYSSNSTWTFLQVTGGISTVFDREYCSWNNLYPATELDTMPNKQENPVFAARKFPRSHHSQTSGLLTFYIVNVCSWLRGKQNSLRHQRWIESQDNGKISLFN